MIGFLDGPGSQLYASITSLESGSALQEHTKPLLRIGPQMSPGYTKIRPGDHAYPYLGADIGPYL
jgi:hypothetical protein